MPKRKYKPKRMSLELYFAADIRRFLQYQPIEARPASTIYQLRKFTRRHKGLVGGLVATLVVLTLGLTGTIFGLHEARQQRDESQRTQERLAVIVDFQSDQLSRLKASSVGKEIISDLRAEFMRGLEDNEFAEGERKAATQFEIR